MPVLLAPIVVIGAALLSFIALLIYERMFGSPLDGLARSVPVVGGYIARGVQAAVTYAKGLFTKYVAGEIDKIVDWLVGLRKSVEGFVDSVNAYLVELPGHLDHLLHVSVHDVVKAFVNPIRNVANDAAADATVALSRADTIDAVLQDKFAGIEGTVKQSIDHAIDVVQNVDLPNLQHVVEGEITDAKGEVAGDVDALRDWAGGWIDDLTGRLNDIPLEDLLAGAAAGTAALALARVIANEAGLSRAECRAKVKNICGTDPRAWEQLLGLAIPLFAFPGLRALVEVGAELVGTVGEVVQHVGES